MRRTVFRALGISTLLAAAAPASAAEPPRRPRLFEKSLAKRLRPALEATHMVVR